ncbi:hypothetical protein CC78DRAFT_69638 [Lojkania enalia]|uniref:Uncharacterized protein n=1 Tax=Lojkania enalia TaxID=147567 RepID=A0A9P4JZL8_9PLEO|nr:hypothetical protein CC78DRAFT_69638 [Didymosphaeria enalia]
MNIIISSISLTTCPTIYFRSDAIPLRHQPNHLHRPPNHEPRFRRGVMFQRLGKHASISDMGRRSHLLIASDNSQKSINRFPLQRQTDEIDRQQADILNKVQICERTDAQLRMCVKFEANSNSRRRLCRMLDPGGLSGCHGEQRENVGMAAECRIYNYVWQTNVRVSRGNCIAGSDSRTAPSIPKSV